jgi:CDP-4-dehydro-6-deoxyglucose reductase
LPDPKFAKPWHGIPREQIDWHPTVDEAACIGCGTCITGCGRLVYRFDFERKKPLVVDPLNCMVGCITCANTCPTHAISFPALETVMALEARAEVRHAIEDDLLARRPELEHKTAIPHAERLVRLVVAHIEQKGSRTRIVTLRPESEHDCMCQFSPGQYLEISIPDQHWMSRAYSIGNAPRADGAVEIQVRRVPEGRFSAWAFDRARPGDVVTARGPVGYFVMRTPIDAPVVLVAAGTGFAPIKAMLEQRLQLSPQAPATLFWGCGDSDDFYELDTLALWKEKDRNLTVTLSCEHERPDFRVPTGLGLVGGTAAMAIESASSLAGQDAYVAGPIAAIPSIVDALERKGVRRDRTYVDCFGGN